MWHVLSGLMRSSLGGRVMDKYLLELFARSQVTIRPAAAVTRTCIQQPGIGPHWQVRSSTEIGPRARDRVRLRPLCMWPVGVAENGEPGRHRHVDRDVPGVHHAGSGEGPEGERVQDAGGHLRARSAPKPSIAHAPASLPCLSLTCASLPVVVVVVEKKKADPKYSGVPRMHYELPDGVVVAVGVERFQVPDILMNTDPVKHLLSGTATHTQI